MPPPRSGPTHPATPHNPHVAPAGVAWCPPATKARVLTCGVGLSLGPQQLSGEAPCACVWASVSPRPGQGCPEARVGERWRAGGRGQGGRGGRSACPASGGRVPPSVPGPCQPHLRGGPVPVGGGARGGWAQGGGGPCTPAPAPAEGEAESGVLGGAAEGVGLEVRVGLGPREHMPPACTRVSGPGGGVWRVCTVVTKAACGGG